MNRRSQQPDAAWPPLDVTPLPSGEPLARKFVPGKLSTLGDAINKILPVDEAASARAEHVLSRHIAAQSSRKLPRTKDPK